MTKEFLDAVYIHYMETKGYSYKEYDLNANWKYWMKDGKGGFSWLRYLLDFRDNRWSIK